MKNALSVVVPTVTCVLGIIGSWFVMRDRMAAEVEERVRFEVMVERLEQKCEQNRVDIWEIKSR